MGWYNQYKARGCSYTYTECKSKHMLHTLSLWGLVTNYGEGGLQNGKGGASEVLPLQKRGGRKSFNHAEGGGGTTSFEVVLISELEVLAIVMGGSAKSFGPAIFSFCSPPSP